MSSPRPPWALTLRKKGEHPRGYYRQGKCALCQNHFTWPVSKLRLRDLQSPCCRFPLRMTTHFARGRWYDLDRPPPTRTEPA